MSCLFCKIVNKEIPATIVMEEAEWLAFRDINPGAPTHVLVIPKEHISGLGAAGDGHEALLGKLLLAAKKVAQAEGISDSGFRTVINHGPDAGQSVFHIHVHVLGKRKLAWPPG